jgi:hypothetical protein
MSSYMPRLKRSAPIFQLKVTLLHIEPPVWRRLLIPSDISLAKLHFAINEAMGWTCSHLHSFTFADRTFGDPELDPDGELDFEDERKVKLSALADQGSSIAYEYDFGDGWEHEIMIEASIEADPRLRLPLCVGGARACPPEDCGGVPGYERLREVLLDGRHPEFDETLTWVGGFYDPEGFDSNRTNQALRALPRQR